MRPVEKLIRFLGKLVILCFVAALVLYFMQTQTLWLYFAYTGVFLAFPYMFFGVLVAIGTCSSTEQTHSDDAAKKALEEKECAQPSNRPSRRRL